MVTDVNTNLKFKSVYERSFALIELSGHNLDLPEETYILISPALKEILFNRPLVGWNLQKATYRASRAFFESMRDHYLFDLYPPETRFEQVNLAGSDCYQLQSAYAKVFNNILPRNYIAISRKKINDNFDEFGKQKFCTKVSYQRFEAKGQFCILGETIATGISAVDSLGIHLPYAIENGLKHMLIFSICGSKIGAQRIYKVFKKYNLPVTFVFGLALFGLGDDGTALMWRDPKGIDNPITLPELQKQADSIFIPGECAIGDWGQRFSDPVAYLNEWNTELKILTNCRRKYHEKFCVPKEYSYKFPDAKIFENPNK